MSTIKTDNLQTRSGSGSVHIPSGVGLTLEGGDYNLLIKNTNDNIGIYSHTGTKLWEIDNNGSIIHTGPNHDFTTKVVNQPISGTTNSTNDDANSDQLAIYNGSTKLWGINESGFVLNPNKPCFAANWNYVDLTVNDEFLNSDGSKNGWTAHYNPQNDFDAVEGIYTAPISGSYYFHFHDNVYRSGSAAGYFDWYKNNVRVMYSRIYGQIDNGTWENISGFLLCSLSAGDTIRLRAYNTIKLDGNNYGLWAGFLLG